MKHIRRFNEDLDKSTYLSAADKLNKLGGSHADRAKALKIHARDRDQEYDIHNLYYHEFKINYKQLGIAKNFRYKDMMLTNSDLYTIVDTKINDRVYNAQDGKAVLVNLQSAKTNDKISIELGFIKYKEKESPSIVNLQHPPVMGDAGIHDEGDEDEGEVGWVDEDEGEVGWVDDDDLDIDESEMDVVEDDGEAEEPAPKKKKNKFFFWKKENNRYKDYLGEINEDIYYKINEDVEEYDDYRDRPKKGDIFLYIRHIDDSPEAIRYVGGYDEDGDDYSGNTVNNFKFSRRIDALEFKRFILDWYKKDVDNFEFISEIKNLSINKLYE